MKVNLRLISNTLYRKSTRHHVNQFSALSRCGSGLQHGLLALAVSQVSTVGKYGQGEAWTRSNAAFEMKVPLTVNTVM